MNRIKSNPFKYYLDIILIFSITIAILGFIADFKNTYRYGGMDLRNRVIGARLLQKGIDPYYFKWDNTMSDLYLDPHDSPQTPVSRVTVPPTVLTLHSILSSIPYQTQRVIWFFFQWFSFLLSLLFFSMCTQSKEKSKLIWIIGLLFISGAYYWRLHMEKGQIYILYVLLITLSFWISQQNFKIGPFLSGFLIGITTSLRPPTIFMNIPFIIYKKWKLLAGNFLGLLGGISLSFVLTDFKIWKKYISAMQVWGEMQLGKVTKMFDGFSQSSAEGLDNLTILAKIQIEDSSFQGVFKKFLGVNLSSNLLITSLIMIMLFFSFLMFKSRKKKFSFAFIYLIGITLVFISEFFIPAPRLSYNDIIWLVILSLIIINFDLKIILSNSLFVFLLLSIIFSTSFHLIIHNWIISDYSMLFYTSLIVIISLKTKIDPNLRFQFSSKTSTITITPDVHDIRKKIKLPEILKEKNK